MGTVASGVHEDGEIECTTSKQEGAAELRAEIERLKRQAYSLDKAHHALRSATEKLAADERDRPFVSEIVRRATGRDAWASMSVASLRP
ncbi:hypothetical protein DIPPA_17634 [Diplonema papillatum]|nr:hypothetical protein DIPPA_17634 [Diplonema papillatum]